MVKFAHISDSHLGGWRQPELQALNLGSFQKTISICIEEKVEFVLFAGDLFDSAFPPIEVLKDAFTEFRRLKEEGIKSYVIAGSHDYSVSGKTFLDVLERAGFCEICKYEERDKKIILKPIAHKSFYIYGYPGKKSGMELEDLKRIQINEPYSNYFRILMLHTTLKESVGDIPMDSIEIKDLPKADYYALGHVHINFESEHEGKPVIYAGPTFPNNFKELEELKNGSFYIIDVGGYTKVVRKEIKTKEIELVEIEIKNSLRGTEEILFELKKRELKDKIVLLKIFGNLAQGKTSDIRLQEVEDYIKKSGAYCFLKNTSKLEFEKQKIEIEFPAGEIEKAEKVLIERYEKENPSYFNNFIFPLLEILSLEKQDGEKQASFESRLYSELSKIFEIELN